MNTLTTHPNTAILQPPLAIPLADLIGDLKKSISQRLTREFRECAPVVVIRRALDDAAEIARSTDFPHLFFPELAREKVRLVSAALCEKDAPSALVRNAA